VSRYTLPSGCVVHLSEFRLQPTYSGHLEGSPETLTPASSATCCRRRGAGPSRCSRRPAPSPASLTGSAAPR
jgi:hypothetical protein